MAISPTESMRQASMTAHDYMLAAVRDIDEIFGKGYAQAHPELVGAFIQTCAIDYLASRLESQLEAIDDNIGVLSSSLNELGEAISKNS
jgi:hypothetical protein